MCGICGNISLNHKSISSQALRDMVETMIHRGPDEDGFFEDPIVQMGMRRLIIIDKQKGSQPVFSSDKNIALIFNGEIFNYKILKEKLIKMNIKFETNSDTEVILKMYEVYGKSCIIQIEGMFSFCLYDKSKNIVWIARDRFGIKPLYYFKNDNNLVFGSTLDSIIKSNLVEPNISQQAIDLYLSSSFIPTPLTIYKDIYKLKPGHEIIMIGNDVSINKYWDINDAVDTKIEHHSATSFNKIFDEAIEKHSISDVPVGTFLSGGIDSSLITAKFSNSNENFSSYTADFESKSPDDTKSAAHVAASLNIRHNNIAINKHNYLINMDELIRYLDEPVYDSSMTPTFMLSKQAKKDQVPVLLAGNGADELFAGYKRHYSIFKDFMRGKLSFLSDDLLEIFGRIFKIDKHKILQLKYKYIGYIVVFSGINITNLKGLLKDNSLENIEVFYQNYFTSNINKNSSFKKTMMLMDIKTYLVDNGLSILDKATMAASIEGRVPYLDHNVAEYVISLDDSCLLGQSYTESKKILRESMDIQNFDKISTRKKMGFDTPIENILAVENNLLHIRNTIEKAKNKLEQYCNYKEIDRIIYDNSEKYNENIMNIYVLSSWFNNKCSQ